MPMPSPFAKPLPVPARPAVPEAMQEATREEEPPAQERTTLIDALSYIYAKSPKQLSVETGLSMSRIKRGLADLMDRDCLDEKNGFYRYQNSSEWKIARD